MDRKQLEQNTCFYTERTNLYTTAQVAKLCTEREVPAGDQLIRQGETGLATDEMYIVKSGHFEVLESRHGSMMMVNQKYDGDIFGELSLMYSTPRTATVQASRYDDSRLVLFGIWTTG
jgi:CRP-like cAMP-binding protein